MEKVVIAQHRGRSSHVGAAWKEVDIVEHKGKGRKFGVGVQMLSFYERKPCFATCSVDHVQIAVNYCQPRESGWRCKFTPKGKGMAVQCYHLPSKHNK